MGTAHQAVGGTAIHHWWPNELNLRILGQNHPQADPNGEEFAYAEEFKSLDFDRPTHRFPPPPRRRLRPTDRGR